MLFGFLYLLSLGESESLDDESDNDESDSGFSDTYYFCVFPLRFVDSVDSVSVCGYVIFAETGVEFKSDILCLTCSYQYELISKVVDSLKYFDTQIPCFLSNFETCFYSYSRSQILLHSLQPL